MCIHIYMLDVNIFFHYIDVIHSQSNSNNPHNTLLGIAIRNRFYRIIPAIIEYVSTVEDIVTNGLHYAVSGVYMCLYVCVLCVYVYCVCMCIYMYVWMCVYVCVCCVCVYTCAYMYLYIIPLSIYIYIYTPLDCEW